MNEGAPIVEERDVALELDLPFPPTWKVRRLGELFDIQQGKALSPDARRTAEQRPFLRTANVLWSRVDVTNVDRMHFTPEEAERLSLRANDLLICEGGEVGRAAVWSGQIDDCSYQNHIHRLRPRSDDVSPRFYMYWMRAALLHLGLYGGTENRTTIPNLSKGRLAQFAVPQPSISEQSDIVSVLDAIRESGEDGDAICDATWRSRRVLLEHLLTHGPVSVTERGNVTLQKTTYGGFAPAHWTVVRLGEIADPKGGKRLPKGHDFSPTRTPYPYLRVIDFADGSIRASDLKYLTPEDHSAIRNYTISSSDVFISIAGTIGSVGIVPDELSGANLTENAAKLVLRDPAQVDPRYLVAVLSSDMGRDQIRALTGRTSQPKLALARIREILIPLPPIEEQQEMVDLLLAFDRKRAAELRWTSVLGMLFDVVLPQLASGRIRIGAAE